MLLSKFVHFTRERSSSSSSSLYAVGATRRRRGAASMASRGRVSTSRRTAPTACRWPGPSCRRARYRLDASRTGSRRRTSSRGRRGARRRRRSTCPSSLWNQRVSRAGVASMVISARTPAVTTGGAAGGHAGARLRENGTGDGGGLRRPLDDRQVHGALLVDYRLSDVLLPLLHVYMSGVPRRALRYAIDRRGSPTQAARATSGRSITSPAAAKSCSRADRRADSTRCASHLAQ